MMPPPSYMDNPTNAVTTRFVKTATNKMRCPIFTLAWTPEGRRLVTGASSGEFTLWNGLTFNFETILQVSYCQWERDLVLCFSGFVSWPCHCCEIRILRHSLPSNWILTKRMPKITANDSRSSRLFVHFDQRFQKMLYVCASWQDILRLIERNPYSWLIAK